MGRPLRRQAPGQYSLFTTRCHQARFFLRPDPELNQAVLEWLARAQLHFPDVRIHAVCVLSNHLHLIVRDDSAQLAAWASYFLGNLARAVNRIRKRRGACFERRYSAEPILDSEALLDRLVYVVTNPTQAGLCERARQWPGVVLFAREAQREAIPVSWIDRNAQRRARERARRRGEGFAESEAFRVKGRLFIDPLLNGCLALVQGYAENEHFCLVLARRLGLPPARSSIPRFEDQIVIVIERYDRRRTDTRILRVHQEISVRRWACRPPENTRTRVLRAHRPSSSSCAPIPATARRMVPPF